MADLSIQTWELLLTKLISKTLDDSHPFEGTETDDLKRVIRSFLPTVPDSVLPNTIQGFSGGVRWVDQERSEIPKRGDRGEIAVRHPFRGKAGESAWILYQPFGINYDCVNEEGGPVLCLLSGDAEPLCTACDKGHDASRYTIWVGVTVQQSIRFRDFPHYFRPTDTDDLRVEGYSSSTYTSISTADFVMREWSAQGDCGEQFILFKDPRRGSWVSIAKISYSFHEDNFVAGYLPLTDNEIKEFDLS